MSAAEMPTREGVSCGAGDADQAEFRLDQQVVGLLLRERPALAVARDVADDELRVARREVGVAQAEAGGGAGCEVLQQHIGAANQPIQYLRRFRMLQVERDAALAAIEPNEEAGLTVHVAVVVTREVALTRALHLDDIGTEIGHVTAADRCRHSVFEGDDADAFEGSHGRDLPSWCSSGRKAPLLLRVKARSMVAAESAAAMPGAAARIGLPAVAPSPAMKGLTVAPASARIVSAAATSHRLMCSST